MLTNRGEEIRLALTLHYDGSAFFGWQAQARERTVQGEIEAAVERLTGARRTVTGSGRTDRGVHATGQVAAVHAGPAVVLSFALAGLACAFAGLCYAEFASMIPVAGSAYTYAYATLGELFAWIIGWDLILEYAVSASTVAVGWSGYLSSLLADWGIHLPPHLLAPRGADISLADGSVVRTGTGGVVDGWFARAPLPDLTGSDVDEVDATVALGAVVAQVEGRNWNRPDAPE